MFFQNKLSKNKLDGLQAFTLIEVLVSVAIILIVSSFVLANYNVGRERFALQRAVHKLAQDIRRVEEMAMSGKEIGPAGAKFYPEGGFGIHFDLSSPRQYILFADCNANRQYNPQANVCAVGISEFIETIQLEPKVSITHISPSTPQNELDITFNAPDPVVSMFPSATQARIRLSLVSGESATTTVNTAGLIAIE